MTGPDAPDHDAASGENPRSRRGLRPFDKRLRARVAVARWMMAADVAAALAGTLLLLGQVMLLAAVIAGAAGGGLRHVPTIQAAALVAIIVARGALVHVVEYSGRRAATTVMSALRGELVERSLRRGGADLQDVNAAELATDAVQGVDGLEIYFAQYLPQVVLAVTVPLAVLLASTAIDPESAVIMLMTLPVLAVFMTLIGRSASARSRANWQALVVLSTHFLDVVRGLPTLRAFNRGRAQISNIYEITEQYRRTTMSTLRLSFLSGIVLDLATTLSTALVAVTLGVRLVGGTLGLRPALTVLLLVPELYAPIRKVGALFHASTDGLAAAERILDALDTAGSDAIDPVAAAVTRNGRGAVPDPATDPISVRSVTVRYPDRPAAALDSLDLDLQPGELLAVVGASGAGKTTLGRLLLGLTRPDEGAVVVGSRPLADVDLDEWRSRLAWAPQHPAVVSGTVIENIALGRPDADAEAIEDVARRAGAHRFIESLPHGYRTVIGAGGRGLSAGQRQRLGLARALLRNASLLVLDEPTVHLDRVAARHVAITIDELRGSRTILLITHDLELAAVADRAVWLDAGRAIPTAGVPAASPAWADGTTRAIAGSLR